MATAQLQPIKEGEVISLADAIAHAQANPDRNPIATGSAGVDWVLGGGLPPSAGVLLAAPPGAGKTTFILETLRKIASRRIKVLFVSSEESTEQLGLRFGRLRGDMPAKLRVVSMRDVDEIEETIRNEHPRIVAIDSLHKLSGVSEDNGFTYSMGSTTAITIAADRFRNLSTEMGLITISVAHVSKEGGIAGANTLQHDQDVILYLNGKQRMIDGRLVVVGPERTLRCDGKNRFVESGRCARLQMLADGLHDCGPWVDERTPWEVYDTNKEAQ